MNGYLVAHDNKPVAIFYTKESATEFALQVSSYSGRECSVKTLPLGPEPPKPFSRYIVMIHKSMGVASYQVIVENTWDHLKSCKGPHYSGDSIVCDSLVSLHDAQLKALKALETWNASQYILHEAMYDPKTKKITYRSIVRNSLIDPKAEPTYFAPDGKVYAYSLESQERASFKLRNQNLC